MRFRPYASAMLKYWRTTKRPGYHGLQKMAGMARAVFLPDFRLQLYLGTYPYLSKGLAKAFLSEGRRRQPRTGRNVRTASPVRVLEKFCREREAAYFKI